MAKVNVPNVKLNDGRDMPLVGFGLWKVPNESAADIVYNAIKTGYRLFDGACGTYIHSEMGRFTSRTQGTNGRQTTATRRSAARVSPAPSRRVS